MRKMTTNNNAVAKQQQSAEIVLRQMLNSDAYKDKFKEVMGERAAGFMSSIIALSSSNSLLKVAEPNSIISAAMMAATLDLPINQNFGYAYVVPYRDYKQGNKVFAQMQIGWKGMLQLAFRSGLYQVINVDFVYEGEICSVDRVTGKLDISGEKTSDNIISYFAYFKLANGFEKSVVMTKAEIEKHAKRYSKSYDSEKGSIWKSHFDEMAAKTVLRRLIGKYGPMSVQMRQAYAVDQGVIREFIGKDDIPEMDYPDNLGDSDAIEVVTVSHEQMVNLLKSYPTEAVENALSTLGFEVLESLPCDKIEEFENVCKAYKQQENKQPKADKKQAGKDLHSNDKSSERTAENTEGAW